MPSLCCAKESIPKNLVEIDWSPPQKRILKIYLVYAIIMLCKRINFLKSDGDRSIDRSSCTKTQIEISYSACHHRVVQKNEFLKIWWRPIELHKKADPHSTVCFLFVMIFCSQIIPSKSRETCRVRACTPQFSYIIFFSNPQAHFTLGIPGISYWCHVGGVSS